MGTGFRALAWTGAKPATGLPAAARAARHRLLAAAAREAHAAVLLLGHTADDVAEARIMRAAGSTTPDPREWSPSPAWPEGRGLFLLRPLLGLRRAALRDWLTACGEGWIDDPANADLRYARPRARAAVGDDLVGLAADEAPIRLAESFAPLPGGGFEVARAALHEATPAERARALALACVCAGGGARLPRSEAAARLAETVAGTLAGARLHADAARVRIVRNAGEAARGGLAPLALAAGATAVWDGRFEVTAGDIPVEVRKLGGLATRLPPAQRRALAELPASVRPALPAILDPEGGVSCPLLGDAPARATPLTATRLRAAAGLIEREPV
jgi:tRNA(Ile)-lysidine synthase